MKKILITLLFTLIITSMVGCSQSGKIPEGSNLTEDDIYTLQSAEDTYEIMDIEEKMNEQDWEDFGELIKEVYIKSWEKMDLNTDIDPIEEGANQYELAKSDALRKLKGEYTEEEKQADKEREELAEKKVKDYNKISSNINNIEEDLQKYINKNLDIIISGTVDNEGKNIIFELNFVHDITVGVVSNTRVEITDIVYKSLDTEDINSIIVKVSINGDYIDKYIFEDNQWDKAVEKV